MSKRFENHLGYWSHRAAFAFRAAFESRSRIVGLHYGEAVVLMRVRIDGAQSLADLSRNIGHSHPTVLAQVTSLERAGYLKREPHSADRRIKIISLTESGNQIAVQLDQIADELQNSVSAKFGKSESADVIKLLRNLTESIAAVEAAREPIRRNEIVPSILPTIQKSATKP